MKRCILETCDCAAGVFESVLHLALVNMKSGDAL